jgi:hypothetical protein
VVYKINPFHTSIWHSPTTVQVGLDSRRVVLPEISSAAERFIDALYFGVAPNQVEAIAAQTRLPRQEAEALLERLRPVLEVEASESAQRPNPGKPLNLDAAIADLVSASLQNSTDGRAVLLERGRRAVFIEVLDATGLLLMLGLAAAGVGTFVTRDNEPVRNSDTGPASFPPAFLGQKRIAAASLMLETTWPSSRLVSGLRLKDSKFNNIDVAVLGTTLVPQLQRIGVWNSRQVPQLEIKYAAGGFEVSPVIVPGSTPCLICRELWRSEGSEEYAAVSAQLAGLELRFDHSGNRMLAAGLAMQSILARLDAVGGFASGNPQQPGGYLVSDAGASGGSASVGLEHSGWDFHYDCACSSFTNREAVPDQEIISDFLARVTPT